MRLSWGRMALGLVLGAQANRLQVRQTLIASTTIALATSPSLSPAPSSAANTTPASVSEPDNTPDNTVFLTATVTKQGEGSTVTSFTTVTVSTIITVTVTTTDIATTTVTRSGQDTATKVIYVTSTQVINAKRAVIEEEVFFALGPAHVPAEPTPVRGVAEFQAHLDPDRVRQVDKRAVVTNYVTVTLGLDGGVSTAVATVTKVIRSTTSTLQRTTSYITTTVQVNAKTTLTVTSTIILKLTMVSTGAVETSTAAPANTAGSGNNSGGGGGSSGSGSGGDGGLSTGAQAGIGVGVSVVGLAIVAGIVYLCMRRRRGPKPDPDDLLGPSSEVPVGAGTAGSRHSRPMSQGLASAPGSVPNRNPMLPNVHLEGYRGTAMGDGRAGYAKPDPYGAAYPPTRNATTNSRISALSAGDPLPRHPTPDAVTALSTTGRPDTAELGSEGAGAKWHNSEAAEMASDNPAAAKWHSDNAHEIDSQPVMSHQSGPVYEMAVESYR
ncbi:uncharacterized protein UV8b_05105 [Ustilaginoidea virens]|uniref:Uncharacterized protein n=1 Tax=Ustilaginoidea virens TaxID=1159556 RepID=A0A063BTV3_USTVR|nr:uncharacterized protein UV8b_05105 [Ustilaginoidea virens]QUC20864.1 hypothetical protein UV8b_05105 [Ustilaginoidea virens]GAO14937.1 hypothetical protein UVI_02007750 [Ustilaginoidea virens]